jgi:hypothetical protein
MVAVLRGGVCTKFADDNLKMGGFATKMFYLSHRQKQFCGK